MRLAARFFCPFANRRGADTPRKTYTTICLHHDLNDTERGLIESLLPSEYRRGAPRGVDLREVFNAILYIIKNGCTWRDLS